MPIGNGATLVSDQPDTSFYRGAGQRATEPSAPTGRGDRTGHRDRTESPYYRDHPYYSDADGYASDANGYAAPTTSARSRRDRRQPERGLPSWLALLVLIGIAGAAGIVDSVSGSAIRGVFGYGLILASLIAILLVRRSGMFPVVVAPPLVYFAASAALLYIRTGGLHDRGKLIDAATNWIVYGFPAIAGATAVVLVIAGIRLVTRR